MVEVQLLHLGASVVRHVGRRLHVLHDQHLRRGHLPAHGLDGGESRPRSLLTRSQEQALAGGNGNVNKELQKFINNLLKAFTHKLGNKHYADIVKDTLTSRAFSVTRVTPVSDYLC